MARPFFSDADAAYMRRALQLARAMLGRTSPNPVVGCVIVRDGRVVGEAATAAGGRPHAETQALAKAGARARGATAYISLEPCAHFGSTPPCAQALIDAKVRRVIAGCVDPFTKVRGRGIAMLRAAGISVDSGLLEGECRELNCGFFTLVAKGRPFAILKLATSVDGRIATPSRDSRWISSPASRALVHQWRAECDAVVVGAGTVITDDPRLTCRIEGGRDPVRVIIDARLRTPPDARVFRQRSQAASILVTTAANAARARRRYKFGRVEILGLPSPRSDRVPLGALMKQMGARGWTRVLIEGGSLIAGAALKARIVDRIAFFVAPRIIGDGLPAIGGLSFAAVRRAIQLRDLRARQIGPDWLLEADL
jgi:diaminohydroxyphosphoribosylaminopyrimidine deaminase/5-amino-6-(5-phosphoribosylamino)uracil reductase